MNYDGGIDYLALLGLGLIALAATAIVLITYLAWSKLMASVQDLTTAADGLTAAASTLKASVDALIAKPAPAPVIPDAIVSQINDATASVNATASAAQTAAVAS